MGQVGVLHIIVLRKRFKIFFCVLSVYVLFYSAYQIYFFYYLDLFHALILQKKWMFLIYIYYYFRSTDGILNGERLNLKWAVPLQDVEVHDDIAFSTKNLMISSTRNKNFGSRSLERNSGN